MFLQPQQGLHANPPKPGSQEHSAIVRQCRDAFCLESQAFTQPETIPILSILAPFLSRFSRSRLLTKGNIF